jgi:hypothetical protein
MLRSIRKLNVSTLEAVAPERIRPNVTVSLTIVTALDRLVTVAVAPAMSDPAFVRLTR